MMGETERRGWTRVAVSLALGLWACVGDGSGAGEARATEAPERAPAATSSRVGQSPAAQVVGPGHLSTEGGDSWISVHPSGDVALVGRHGSGWSGHTVHVAFRDGDGWSEPVVAPFSGVFEDRGARFSPDGSTVYFSSNRPAPGDGSGARSDFDLWTVRWTGDGWGEPRRLPAPMSTDANEIHPTATADGHIVFASDRAVSLGRSDLFLGRPSGGSWSVEHLPPPVNTERSEADAWISADGTTLVFARTDDPAGYGGDDLWHTTLVDGAWSTPRNLGPTVNTPEYEYGPALSADGSLLYFTSHRDGDADLFAVPAESVGLR